MGYDRFQEEELAPQNFCAWDRALTTAPPRHPQFSPLSNKGNMPGQPSAPQPCTAAPGTPRGTELRPALRVAPAPCSTMLRSWRILAAPRNQHNYLSSRKRPSSTGRTKNEKPPGRPHSPSTDAKPQCVLRTTAGCSSAPHACWPGTELTCCTGLLVPGPPRASPVCG